VKMQTVIKKRVMKRVKYLCMCVCGKGEGKGEKGDEIG